MSSYDYCSECWCELPGFPETDEYEECLCPPCLAVRQARYNEHAEYSEEVAAA